jgi:hypothetical protein
MNVAFSTQIKNSMGSSGGSCEAAAGIEQTVRPATTSSAPYGGESGSRSKNFVTLCTGSAEISNRAGPDDNHNPVAPILADDEET